MEMKMVKYMIAVFVENISNYPYWDVQKRKDEMIELCNKINKQDWIEKINNDDFEEWQYKNCYLDALQGTDIWEKYSPHLLGSDPGENYDVELMIGIIAADIRFDWGHNIKHRLNAIYELCDKICRVDWIEDIRENEDHIYNDGRWFTYWDGPYCDDNSIRYHISDELWNEYKDVLIDSSL